ncbi:EAL domain-containing response regulator [Sulfuricurvum sp.]|uniref:EAL domain-containing response regulator n=1 Tax=Sulfuricurvum sp. TaxID=2025608 RepID=UPI002E30DF0A|nr:EAL domain-containing protein [Sulfuricurvum sp.]HEX5329770.1 EAL domain-containing protein [Sulfuricurvum sp.]
MSNQIQQLKEGAEARSVLIIDDDMELSESLSRILHVFFKECVIATDGEEAYQIYRSRVEEGNSFTLVISDLELPKMGGLRLIKQIRALSTHQPILILSAHDEAEYMAEAIRLDVEGYLIKPLSMPKLFESLEKIFTQPSQNGTVVSFDNDPVTGWKSFQELADRIQTLESPPFTLLRIRVNHLSNIFKFVGDVFANEYISELSALLQSISQEGKGDFYRIGVDEFCLVLEGEVIEQASNIASSMISIARYFHTSEKGIVLNSSLSIGIAYGKDHILFNSKLALDMIPDRIGGGYNVYSLSEQNQDSTHMKSREILRMIFDALHEENIVPFFAPVRWSEDHEICGYESVVKIRKDDRLYGSETFRSIALDMGQMGMITRSIIRRIFELSRVLTPNKPIFLTLSAIELSDESLLTYIHFWAQRNNISPSYICFHIVDGLKILQNSTLLNHVKTLQMNGFKIMLSQFGIGEFNLLTLLSLRPDFIKLHPELIAQSDNADIRFILSKMVEIAHHIGAQCIAQAINDEHRLEWIKDANIDAFSGSLAGNIFEVTHEH